MTDINLFYNELKKNNINIKKDVILKKYTSFKIGGKADLFTIPDSLEKLKIIFELAVKCDIPVTVIGNGSNLLVSDLGIRGLVIKIAEGFNDITVKGNKITCGAGAMLSKICKTALEHSLSGIEFAYGIPGSAGGAAFMNAGAYDGEMKDVLISCTHITRNGEIGKFSKDQLNLSYRSSIYSELDYVILSLELELIKGNKTEIEAKMADFMQRRIDKQPINLPSAGSVFKRPPGNFAGTLIEKAELKGFSIGGAMVSEKHSGFIVNYNNKATCKDVLNLIEHIKKTVFKKFGINLECEIKKIGE